VPPSLRSCCSAGHSLPRPSPLLNNEEATFRTINIGHWPPPPWSRWPHPSPPPDPPRAPPCPRCLGSGPSSSPGTSCRARGSRRCAARWALFHCGPLVASVHHYSFMPLSQRFDHNRDTCTCACTCVTRLVWRRRVPWGLGVLATGGSSSSGSSSRRVRSTALFFQVRLRVALFAWVLVYGGLAFLPATREARASPTRRE